MTNLGSALSGKGYQLAPPALLLLMMLATGACGETVTTFGTTTTSSGTGGTSTSGGTGGTSTSGGTGGASTSSGTGGTGGQGATGGSGGSDLCAGVDCSALTNECATGVCNPVSGSCEAEPLPAGTACGESTVTDCSAADSCDGAGSCSYHDAPDGSPCDDCAAGPCSGCAGGICQDHLDDCNPVGNISACNSPVASSNDGAGSTSWTSAYAGCIGSNDETGPEIAYTFTAVGSAGALAILTNVTADLDLFVIQATPAAECLVTECIAYGYSQGGEEVFFPTTAGTTYFIVVEGWNGAVSGFDLFVHERGDILLSEVFGGSPDYVEVQNRKGCAVDLDPYVVRHRGGCENSPSEHGFPPGSIVAAGGVFRLVDNDAAVLQLNERPMGTNVCDYDGQVSGHTALCLGSCDLNGCSNLLDFVQRSSMLSSTPPGGPPCAGFDTPIDTTAMIPGTGQATHRTGFAGGPLSWLNADWIIAPYSRN